MAANTNAPTVLESDIIAIVTWGNTLKHTEVIYYETDSAGWCQQRFHCSCGQNDDEGVVTG